MIYDDNFGNLGHPWNHRLLTDLFRVRRCHPSDVTEHHPRSDAAISCRTQLQYVCIKQLPAGQQDACGTSRAATALAAWWVVCSQIWSK